MKTGLAAFAVLCVCGATTAIAQDAVAVAPNGALTPEVGGCGTIIYDTTHVSTQGAEITAAANGPATSMADLITLGGSERFVCSVTIEVFTLAATTPFNLTMSMYTDCSTSGAGNSPCGNGPGTLIAGSAVTVTGITPPALGTIFPVTFTYPLLDLSSEVDDTISVSVNASRSDVFWRLGETVTVGTQPDAGTSFVERCGSTGTNNGCQRNFGVQNNFAITIQAQATPVELESFSID